MLRREAHGRRRLRTAGTAKQRRHIDPAPPSNTRTRLRIPRKPNAVSTARVLGLLPAHAEVQRGDGHRTRERLLCEAALAMGQDRQHDGVSIECQRLLGALIAYVAQFERLIELGNWAVLEVGEVAGVCAKTDKGTVSDIIHERSQLHLGTLMPTRGFHRSLGTGKSLHSLMASLHLRKGKATPDNRVISRFDTPPAMNGHTLEYSDRHSDVRSTQIAGPCLSVALIALPHGRMSYGRRAQYTPGTPGGRFLKRRCTQ